MGANVQTKSGNKYNTRMMNNKIHKNNKNKTITQNKTKQCKTKKSIK